jgi:hypothetical protein
MSRTSIWVAIGGGLTSQVTAGFGGVSVRHVPTEATLS